jgi:hypothetical protein
VQFQVRRWQPFRSATLLFLPSFLRAFGMIRRRGSRQFAFWRDAVGGVHETGPAPDDDAADQLPGSDAGSAAEQWQFYVPLFVSSLPRGRLVMRREVNGHWQYRPPTPEEETDYTASEGW